MSIFGSILSAIGLGSEAQAQTPADGASDTSQSTEDGATTAEDATAGSASSGSAASGSAASQQPVDVVAMLQTRAANAGQTLNYGSSIVDLLKLLDLPSDLDTRRQLAHELNYTGSTENTAEMNMWLHREVMSQLASHGGQVPDDWKHPA